MENQAIHKSLKQDQFEGVDFLDLDDLLTEEQKLIRSSIRDFVKKEISPYIEDWAQMAHFPYEIVKKFGEPRGCLMQEGRPSTAIHIVG